VVDSDFSTGDLVNLIEYLALLTGATVVALVDLLWYTGCLP
jgi:hypothetical protein